MISFEAALDKVLQKTNTLKAERMPLLDCCYKVLAAPVSSHENLPPFNRSPLDGYALWAKDTEGAALNNPRKLKVVDSVPAGSLADVAVSPGLAVRIMTGAPIPSGADCVIRQENTQKAEAGKILIYEELQSGENIIKAGEDVKKGETIFEAGDIITPGDIGLLAALGHIGLMVFPPPKVGILATGSELIDISEKPTKGKIRNSNSYMLAALVREYGGTPTSAGVCQDNLEHISHSIENLLEKTDILVTTGGVSVGDYDLLPDALEKIGARRLFWKVALKPGTCLLVAEKNNKLIIALSGNPAACLITFQQFAGPCLLKMQGRRDYNHKWGRAVLTENINVRTSSHLRFVRGHWKHNDQGVPEVKATGGSQKPGVLSSFRSYNCYIVVQEKTNPCKGDWVNVQFNHALTAYI
jgi:molybdopterin molybdotransferase